MRRCITRASLAFFVAAFCVGSCTVTPSGGGPVRSFAPHDLVVGYAEAEAHIRGDGFELDAVRDLGCGGPALRVSEGYGAVLADAQGRGTALANVVRESEIELSATVPAGLAAGTYYLTVIAPSGERFSLPELALVVSGGDSDTDLDAGSDTDTDGDADTDSDTDTDTDGDADTDSDSDTDADTDSDSDSDSDTDGDADTDTDSDSDTGTGTSGDCTGGVALYGICWFLAGSGENCSQVCGIHGGYAEASPEYIGTSAQGGSLEECAEIFTALGYGGDVVEAYRAAGEGVGCHRWEDGTLYWLTYPGFDPDVGVTGAAPVCGCLGAAL